VAEEVRERRVVGFNEKDVNQFSVNALFELVGYWEILKIKSLLYQLKICKIGINHIFSLKLFHY
jgi:hypothetical protein